MSVFRCVCNNRLIWYRDGNFAWDTHWSTHINPQSLFPEGAKSLNMLECIRPYLPKAGRILEAGCGMGQWVHLLRNNGYDCEGVDNASQTIAQINRIKPDLPVRTANLLALDVPDATYSALISLGVVEHRQAGPEPFFKESWRVLIPGGTAVFTVPFFSPLRRFKAICGGFEMCDNIPEGFTFYQQAFTTTEFCNIIEHHGFRVEAIHHYDAWKGLKDEISLAARLNKSPNVRKYKRFFNRQNWLLPWVAHMLAVVCHKDLQ